jgi:hypothetical protein
VKVAVPSPGTSACYDSQIARVSRIFNRTAAWRINDADIVSRMVNEAIVLWFRFVASRLPRTVPAAPLD